MIKAFVDTLPCPLAPCSYVLSALTVRAIIESPPFCLEFIRRLCRTTGDLD